MNVTRIRSIAVESINIDPLKLTQLTWPIIPKSDNMRRGDLRDIRSGSLVYLRNGDEYWDDPLDPLITQWPGFVDLPGGIRGHRFLVLERFRKDEYEYSNSDILWICIVRPILLPRDIALTATDIKPHKLALRCEQSPTCSYLWRRASEGGRLHRST